MLDYIKKSNYTELSMINTSNSHKTHGLIIPSVADTQLSQISSEALTSSFQRASISAQKIKLVDSNGNEKVIDIPLVACQLLADILEQMAEGKAVSLISMNAEINIQEAANLLNVSSGYMLGLLKSGAIPYRQIGKHYRLQLEDVIKYKNWINNERSKALDELVDQAQELQMGYE